LLIHYSYSKLKNSLVYQFTTKNEITYRVHFVKDETLIYLSGTADFEQTYQIVIEKTTDTKPPFDSRVFLTIEAIIIEFFNDTEKVLSFVCDTSDGKELTRFKKFNRWYKTSKHNKSIIKLNVMVHKNNSKFNHLESAFFSIKQLIINEKP